MKKKIKQFIISLSLILVLGITNVYANEIKNIDVNMYLNKDGSADVEEVWQVKGSNGTEWYHPFRNLGKTKITNYTVLMDGNQLQYKNWNINESLSAKAGYYGINYTDTDTELCFGKYDYNFHTFTLKYHVENLIFNTDDAQDLAMEFGIMSIPCVILFKDGKEVKRSVGLRSKEEILKMVDE